MKKEIRKAIEIKKLKSNNLNYQEIGDKINIWKTENYKKMMSAKRENKFKGAELLKSLIPFVEKYSKKLSILNRLILFIKRLFKMKNYEKNNSVGRQ